MGASWDCDARLFRIQGDCASCALTVAGNLEAMGYQNQMHHQMPPPRLLHIQCRSVFRNGRVSFEILIDTGMILLDEKYSELGMYV